MKKDRAQYFELQKKYDKLLIDFGKLKRDFLKTVDDCITSKHKLREVIKKQKEKIEVLEWDLEDCKGGDL